ncbi:MAG: T9SS type A sorting domain-containing protein [Bacteroidia bacterium]|nr:T9SS type A sorting domain-containing protein [Bacteroidia bacterium]
MRILVITLSLLFLFQENVLAQVSTDNVFVLPIRRVKAGQDIDDFKAKRDAYVALLEAESGTLTDREFQPFFEFTNSGLPVDSVFVGLTSFADFQTFQTIGTATSGQVANDFFATFDFISFQVLQPLDSTEQLDLADFANLGTGQVWEVAVRDIAQYPNFDQADYEQKRDAYLAVLAAQDNFVREVQWRSLSDSNVVVGMTVYKDAQSYSAVNADTTFINAYLATGFLQNYPINVYGAIHNPLKGTLDPACQDIGEAAFPEDVTEYNGFLYTSNYFNGAISRKNLSTGELSTFVPAASDSFSSAWGLRVDVANNRLLSIANRFYDFNPANARAGKVNAYDLATGNLLNTWDLPIGCVGNSIDIDSDGNYFVGDIGPDTRIIKIDPNTDAVTTWADDSQWTDGSFGTGGMVWNQEDGFYVAHAGVLWFVPQNADGTAATAVEVNLTGTTAVDGSGAVLADGMTWAGSNTIFYAENDVFTPGWRGIVHRVELSDSITGSNANYIENINDCSGVYFSDFNGQDYLYVNESQFGVPFGVNFVPSSNPFCVKTFAVNDISTSVLDLNTGSVELNIFPNPTRKKFKIRSKADVAFEKVELYAVDGRLVKTFVLNSKYETLSVKNLENGVYLLHAYLKNGQQGHSKLIIEN